jgi:hypothetical protein
MQTSVWSTSLESWNSANQYYHSQLPLFTAAAANYHLNEYFTHSRIEQLDMDWFAVISARMASMAQMHRQSPPRDDYKIEKNKCEMNHFFALNKLPFAAVLKRYSDPIALALDWDSDSVFAQNQTFPVILKTCHITQGIMKSTMVLPSAQYVRRNKPQIKEWFVRMWSLQPDDWTRPWYRDGNEITQQLTPGIFFQTAFESHYNAHMRKSVVVEMRVEVFWGRAYLANTDSVDGVNTLILRDGTVETYPSIASVVTNVPQKSAIVAMDWITSEQHLDKCVWALAERTAKAIGIDSVRVDIFIAKERPDGCMLNEVSVSSGKDYHMHSEVIKMLWTQPHVDQTFRVYDPQKKVYAQIPGDSPN